MEQYTGFFKLQNILSTQNQRYIYIYVGKSLLLKLGQNFDEVAKLGKSTQDTGEDG